MMVPLLIYLLMITFQLSAVSGQIFSFIQPATGPSNVCEGSDVTLQCAVAISFGNTTGVRDSVWSRNISGMITIITTQPPVPNHRLVFNSITGVFTDLEITNVTLEDDNTVYTCSSTDNTITSSVVLNVTGIPPVKNLMAVDNCINVTVNWNITDEGSCKHLSYNVSLILRDDDVTLQSNITSNTTHTFTGVETYNELFNVSVTALNGNVTGLSRTATVGDCVPPTVTNPMGSASVDTIIVTWDVANSPNCGAVYYMVMISPDMMNPPMNVTKLTATFTDLINDTNYNITVTPYCRVVAGNNATMTIRTSSPVSTQSNNSEVPGQPDENTQSDGSVLTIVVTIVVVVVAIGFVVIIIIMILCVKYRHHHKKIDLNSGRKTEDNCYVGTQDDNKSLEIASPYAVSGPTPAWSTHPTHLNTDEPSVDKDHVDESVHNDNIDEDESIPPLLTRLNYAEIWLTNEVPKIMELDKHVVVYAETKPA